MDKTSMSHMHRAGIKAIPLTPTPFATAEASIRVAHSSLLSHSGVRNLDPNISILNSNIVEGVLGRARIPRIVEMN